MRDITDINDQNQRVHDEAQDYINRNGGFAVVTYAGLSIIEVQYFDDRTLANERLAQECSPDAHRQLLHSAASLVGLQPVSAPANDSTDTQAAA